LAELLQLQRPDGWAAEQRTFSHVKGIKLIQRYRPTLQQGRL
jgi:hypothetical protein